MKYDLFIKILERGRDVGFGRKFNISDILKNEFPKPTTTDRDAWNSEIEIQIDVLRDMRNHLHIIKFDNIEEIKVFWYQHQSSPTWFDNIEFNIWVTVAGLDYLNQYYLRQSNFSLNGTLETSTENQTTTNKTIADNSSNQTWILLVTVLITISNLIVSVFNINSGDEKDKLNQQIQEQSIQIHKLQIMLLQPKSSPFHEITAKKISPKKP